MLGDIEVDVLFVELSHLDDGLTGAHDLPRFDFQCCDHAIPVGRQLGVCQLIDRMAQLGFERRRPFSRRGVGGLMAVEFRWAGDLLRQQLTVSRHIVA